MAVSLGESGLDRDEPGRSMQSECQGIHSPQLSSALALVWSASGGGGVAGVSQFHLHSHPPFLFLLHLGDHHQGLPLACSLLVPRRQALLRTPIL